MRSSRRTLLRGLLGGAGLTVAARPAWAGRRRPTFVLVHGSMSTTGFWAPLVRELAERGHRSLPVELPGHGIRSTLAPAYQAPQDADAFARAPSSTAALTLEDHVEHVVELIRQVARHGPVVLVGHSLGGSSITRAACAVPDLVDHLVYVSAFCCVELKSPLDYLGTAEGRSGAAPAVPATVDQSMVPSGVSRTNFRSGDPAFLRALKAAVLADVPADRFLAVLNAATQPDETIGVSLADARIDPTTWGRIPRTYVRLTADRLVTPALQDRMIAEADRRAPRHRFAVREIRTSHLGVMLKHGELGRILGQVSA
ncbi:alpha/beta hydrolase [Kribbella sp. DT2]|uniref:alpha/beta hydrolase n=1 Tax=Kribbella sp. DT2 TaxID=3393427 RepID=UPI003CF83F65